MGVGVQLGRAAQGGHGRRLTQGPHAYDHSDEQLDRRDTQRPPAQAVERRWDAHRDVATQVADPQVTSTGDASAGGRHASGHLGQQLRVRGAGAKAGQVTGCTAVERDQLVDLGPAEAGSGYEVVQPFPLVAVGHTEGVNIHERSVA